MLGQAAREVGQEARDADVDRINPPEAGHAAVGPHRLAADARPRAALDGNEAAAHRVVVGVHRIGGQLGQRRAQVVLVGAERGLDAADLAVFIDEQVPAVERERERRVQPQPHFRHRSGDGARQQRERERQPPRQEAEHLVNVR